MDLVPKTYVKSNKLLILEEIHTDPANMLITGELKKNKSSAENANALHNNYSLFLTNHDDGEKILS